MVRCVLLLLVVVAVVVGQSPPLRFERFFEANRDQTTKLPRSYYVYPLNYFAEVPEEERPHPFTEAEVAPACNNQLVSAELWNKYTFQTEEMLTSGGLNVYDGSVWSIAMALYGHHSDVATYNDEVLFQHKTAQFPNIRGSNTCHGVIEWDQCSDPEGVGACGLCYGDGSDKTLPVESAYFFRMISDWWAYEGTVDARCPELNHMWSWNDYKPVLGENAWAILLGGLQTVYMRSGRSIDAIPDSSPEMQLAINFIPAMRKMVVPDVGGLYFAPRNMYFRSNPKVGSSISTENNVSVLAGLKALLYLLKTKTSPMYKEFIPELEELITGVMKYLKSSFDPTEKYFRQGGEYNPFTREFTWGQGPEVPLFAVDCQTWAMAILGSKQVDEWFGSGTSLAIWEATKRRGGYKILPNGTATGLGYTDNEEAQVFSGEWTLGAINWLHIMADNSDYSDAVKADLRADAQYMRDAVNNELTTRNVVHGIATETVLYANKRYEIPFGWYANPIPSLASTGWAVMVDIPYNPFMLDGSMSAEYPSTQPSVQ